MLKISKTRANVEKLNKKYRNKRFLDQEDFALLNPIILTRHKKVNDSYYSDLKESDRNNMVGMVIESGFLSKRFLLHPSSKRYSIEPFPYDKIISKEKAKLKKKANQSEDIGLSKSQKDRIYFRLSNNQSFFAIAGAGSGKSQGLVLPSVLANALGTQPNMIITDPKAEIYKASNIFLKENGYNVRVINMLDGKNTDCFSPFTEIKELIWNWCMFPEDISNLIPAEIHEKLDLKNSATTEIESIIASVGTKEKQDFWDKAGLGAMKLGIWLIIDDLECDYRLWLSQDNNFLKEEEVRRKQFDLIFIKLNFQSLHETCVSLSKKSYLQLYKDRFNIDLENVDTVIGFDLFKRNHPGIIEWKQILGASDNVVSNTFVVVSKQLQIFNNPLLKNLTIYNTFTFDELTGEDPNKKPLALFIVVNNAAPETLSYIAWFLNYLILKMQTFAISGNREKLRKPLLFLLEEIGNIPIIENLPVLVNEGRGKNMIAALIFQTFDQYKRKYGDSGFMRSCEYKVFLTNTEAAYSEEIAKYSGTYSTFDEKLKKNIDKPRLTQQDVSSLPPKRALIQHLSTNIPYRSYLLPIHFLDLKKTTGINITIDDPIYLGIGNIDAVYSPVNRGTASVANLPNWKEIILDDSLIMQLESKEAFEVKKLISSFSPEKLEEILGTSINILEKLELLENIIEKRKIEKLQKINNVVTNVESNNQEMIIENYINPLILEFIPKKERNIISKNITIWEKEPLVDIKEFDFLNINNQKDMKTFLENIVFNNRRFDLFIFQYNLNIPNFVLLHKTMETIKNKNTELFHLMNLFKLTESLNLNLLNQESKDFLTVNGGVSKLRASVHFFSALYFAKEKNELDNFIASHFEERKKSFPDYLQAKQIIVETNYIEGMSIEVKQGIKSILKDSEFIEKLKSDWEII